MSSSIKSLQFFSCACKKLLQNRFPFCSIAMHFVCTTLVQRGRYGNCQESGGEEAGEESGGKESASKESASEKGRCKEGASKEGSSQEGSASEESSKVISCWLYILPEGSRMMREPSVFKSASSNRLCREMIHTIRSRSHRPH